MLSSVKGGELDGAWTPLEPVFYDCVCYVIILIKIKPVRGASWTANGLHWRLWSSMNRSPWYSVNTCAVPEHPKCVEQHVGRSRGERRGGQRGSSVAAVGNGWSLTNRLPANMGVSEGVVDLLHLPASPRGASAISGAPSNGWGFSQNVTPFITQE